MPQVTLISFFKYQGLKNKWHALGRMGNAPLKHTAIDGLSFWKPLGSGSGNGFSIKPDFSTYGLITVFESEAHADTFINSEVILEYKQDALAYSHIFMHTIKTQGAWGGSNPFIKNSAINFENNSPIAVITRATIKPQLALRFWKIVPKVSKSMENFRGLIYSKGIGEWPIFMQATFSVWENIEAMKAYAYNNLYHAEMIKKTKELDWYSEELFARFKPYKVYGDLVPLQLK